MRTETRVSGPRYIRTECGNTDCVSRSIHDNVDSKKLRSEDLPDEYVVGRLVVKVQILCRKRALVWLSPGSVTH